MMPSGPPDEGRDKEFMTTLAKGLAILSAFGKQRPTMTLSDAATVANLSRAAARRVLRTLAQLGYVAQDGRAFSLTPRVLELGFAYLSGQDWIGRAQLGCLDGAEIWRRLRSAPIEAYTPYTITDMQALFDRVCADREQGFSIVDEELERGLRSIAVPVLDRSGQAVGAINLSAHSTRTTRNEMREKFLPELKAIAQRISQAPRPVQDWSNSLCDCSLVRTPRRP